MMSISCKNTTVCALLYMISIVSARYLIVTQQDFNFEAELVNNNGKKTEFTDLEPAGPETYTSGWKDNNLCGSMEAVPICPERVRILL